MAYADLYTSSFDDLNNDLIDVAIQEEAFPSASTAIKLDGNKSVEIFYNLKDRVFSTAAVVNIVNDFADKFLFAKMIAEPYETYKLVITKTLEGASASNIYFEGFLLPQTVTQNVTHRSFVALTFSNGLTMLENITPSFLTTGDDDQISEMDILDNILSYLNLDYTIYINSSLYEDSMSSAEQADNPLEFTYLNRLAFYRNDGEWDDALTILNKILKSINAYCYIRDERIMIERFVDKATNPKVFWTWEIGSSSGQTGSFVQEAFTEIDLDSLTLKTNNIQYQADPPVKKLKVQLSLLQFHNMIANYFDRNLLYTVLQYNYSYWTYHTEFVLADTNFSNTFITRGVEITKAGTLPDFADGFLTYRGMMTNKADLVTLNFKFKFWRRMAGGWGFDFRYRISLGSTKTGAFYFIDVDSAIGAGVETVTQTIEHDSNPGDYKYDHEITKTFDLEGKLDALGLDGDIYVNIKMLPVEWYSISDGVRHTLDGALFGDFSMSQDDTKIDNLLEAELNNDAYKTVDEHLDLYDAGYINYRVTKLLKGVDKYETTDSWTDDFNTSKSLQQHYILNRGNLLNASSPTLVIVVDDRSVNIQIDDIFYTALLEDDLGANMKFYVANFKYNMRQHTYTLTLKKWLADVGKDII